MIEKPQTAEQINGPQCSGIESEVCRDIAARQQKGIAKYGTTVADNPLPLDKWLEHAYQEMLDGAIYLKRAMRENSRLKSRVEELEGANEVLTYNLTLDRYSQDEIEAACGGDVALSVRRKVMNRRVSIMAERQAIDAAMEDSQ